MFVGLPFNLLFHLLIFIHPQICIILQHSYIQHEQPPK